MPPGVVTREILCKSALTRTKITGFQYCINPYTGCAHACLYCYASFMCRFTDHREKWGRFLDVKINFCEALARQLYGRTRPEGRVLVGTVTDAYQPAESVYKLTRASLEMLADYQLLDVHILTKSALVQRDIPILRRLRSCQVGFTITTVDSGIARVIEPGASAPSLRFEAARELIKAGIPVWVFVAPLLPGLTDTEESLTSLLKAVYQAGIRKVHMDNLNPYPAVVRRLKSAYRRYFSGAFKELESCLYYPELYRNRTESRFRRICQLTGLS